VPSLPFLTAVIPTTADSNVMSNLQRAYSIPSVRGCGTSAIIPFLTAISLRAFDAAPSLAFDTVIDSFPANKHSIPKIREQPKTTGFTNRGYSCMDVTFIPQVCPA
jgi:hypothetical protein